ncbi:MAG: bifunctional hydroxymethylpyrimidine kinase/phosphomethylpyrimidine kinase [Parachlamydiaceae bacterium]|nr:bifunctional hydroxymethylpyrimidine kinase/phosphomethylpyrimidine kinase [Parachlamydiaceae bacterium]
MIKGIRDCLVTKGQSSPVWIEAKYIETDNLHGTGCTFSAAIASFLARKEDLLSSVKKAKEYITNAIERV